jgi:UDP-N-acetylmuramoyl-tripeptide--D-alanyl-D-alanine ligase
MIELTLGQVAAVTQGTLHGADPMTRVTGSVEFDSRLVTPGGLFVAFAGEHADGHEHAAAAVEAGAVAAVVTRPVAVPHVLVGDGLAAMAALATEVARHLSATVIGITGSSGKTSTKDLVAALVERAGPTIAPPGSFNNELGHPYTVLRADASTRFLVLETSARGIGHIRALTRIAPPRIGVVLNVGSAHLGEFGSREAIATAKGELIEALPAATDGGVAILNGDDPLVASMANRTRARVVTVGESPGVDVRADQVRLDDLGHATFRLSAPAGTTTVALPLVGGHHVGNALAAAAVAMECGLSVPGHRGGPVRGRSSVALADGARRARRRRGCHQRRLQRQSGVGSGRVEDPGRDWSGPAGAYPRRTRRDGRARGGRCGRARRDRAAGRATGHITADSRRRGRPADGPLVPLWKAPGMVSRRGLPTRMLR